MICGWWTRRLAPAAASVRNQTIITGPNSRPTTCVPNRWIANSPVRTARAIGSTIELRLGAATLTPSTADSTEMAGVIMPSP